MKNKEFRTFQNAMSVGLALTSVIWFFVGRVEIATYLIIAAAVVALWDIRNHVKGTPL